VLVTLNDARVHLFRQTVPEGRYLFPVDPWKIFVSAGPTVANRVGIRSWHMNAGHYAVNSDYSLIVRTGWSERHTFARSVDEARAVVRVRGAIHGEADLVLVANAVDLPVNVPEAGPLEFALTVVNLGEARSTPARVRMLVSNRPLAETAVPALEPLAERRIVMSLPYDGEMAAVTFALEQPGRDLDPANDVLVFNLWAPRQRAYDESSPTRPAPSPEPAPVDVPLAFAPMIDFSVPSFDGDRVIYLSDYAGKVVLINWWRTTCGWSQRESEKLVALDRKHRGNGLVILGISDDTADSVDDVSTYLQQRGMTWPNALNDQGEVTREIVRGRDQTPGNYLVLRSGHYAYLGLDRSDANWRQLEASVESALAAPPPAGPPVERRKLAVAEPLSLPDLEGQTVTLANYSGRPIVVNFFNEGNCDWVGGVLSALHRDYAAAGLQLIGVGLDGDEGLRRCIAQNLIQYPVLRGDEAIRKRWLGGSQAWGVFFITREGRVFKKIVNSINSGLEQAVFTAYAKHLLRDTHA
jgi:peroxiredoxin